MLADVGRQLQVPQCIVVTVMRPAMVLYSMVAMRPDMVLYSMVAMRPDMVLNSECEHVVYCIELTIPFEEAIEEAFESTQDPWRWVLEAL